MQPASGPAVSTRSLKRRSARIKLRIAITIHIAGGGVVEAETVSVSKYGAKIRILGACEKLACGQRLSVTIRTGKRAKTARVVWLDKTSEPCCGIELDQPDNFWGLHFPAKQSDDGRPDCSASAPKALAPSADLNGAEHPARPGELCITPRMGEPILQDEATDTRTIPAHVTGFSGVRVPLSDRVDIVFTRPDEATALFPDMVEPGTSVRLQLAKDRVVMGRVAATGALRQAGKWRVRIKCEAPCF